MNESKKKLLIISSYNTPCGIAQYVEHLEPVLKANHDWEVEVAPLPVKLFRTTGKRANKYANKLFAEILEKAKHSDVVNLQFEPGLYGVSPLKIWSRINSILNVSRKVVVTHHTVFQVNNPMVSRSRSFFMRFISNMRLNYVILKLFKVSRKRTDSMLHIMHTERDKNNMAHIGDVPHGSIVDFPLLFLSKDQKKHFNKKASRDALNKIYSLEDKIVIGCFGFLHKDKGIEVAIQALRYLPENYHLVIAGGTHPQSIVHGEVDQPYIAVLHEAIRGKELKLNKKILDNKLADFVHDEAILLERIHFTGALSNNDFDLYMKACDAIVLPYSEVGQSSSGPAGHALDLDQPLFCSNIPCFRHLERYAKNAIHFFELSNYMELAEKIDIVCNNKISMKDARHDYRENYNIEKRASMYIDLCERLTS